ncbi:hypothetical protein SNE40_010350 [Patella caerulea]|uniref:Profilin n=2 Tax=Patella caerulea TaxID=87958 RepID=A0AAN8JU34_PATCE
MDFEDNCMEWCIETLFSCMVVELCSSSTNKSLLYDMQMSWEPYLAQLQSVGVEIGGLYGKNGALWASHPEFQCNPNEILIVVDALTSFNDNIYSTGLILSGKRWTVIRRENDVEVLILKGKDPDNSKTNLIIALSGMAVVCGANKSEDVSAGVIRNGVERVRDYLKSVNY